MRNIEITYAVNIIFVIRNKLGAVIGIVFITIVEK